MSCPVCDTDYGHEDGKHKRTRHHIFPRHFFKRSWLVVYVCRACHSEFHYMFRNLDPRRWTKKKCVKKWVIFCKSKGKDAYEIYPELLI